MMKPVTQNQVVEWSLTSGKSREDPFNDLEASASVQSPDGREQIVPAFWAGGDQWRVRFASHMPGRYRLRSVCSDASNSGLHGQMEEVEVTPYRGDNPLHLHGPVRVAKDRRHFEHHDGTPFFWLGDTWWMGLCQRLGWPSDFQALAADRVSKGFSVVQIVAGLYPDMPAFDERGANEAGFPWESAYRRIRPEYFDAADRRIAHLVTSGLLPCIVGCWGYFLPWMGLEKMKQHWRYLVARYGAYPVTWCLAGEGTMPYYLSENYEADRQFLKHGWTEMARFVREIDPYRRPITIHPSLSGRDCVDDSSVLDFDMLQTGHSDRGSLPNTVKQVARSCQAAPTMPVVQGEVCYEGIGASCREEVQRWMFWACILGGAAGFTYGATGLWQVNGRDKPYGASPHGMSWGHTTWDQAYPLPGSRQLGYAKRFLSRYPWWQFEPQPRWVDPCWTDELSELPFTCGKHDVPLAGGIPRKVRVIYQPLGRTARMVKGLEPDVAYRLRLLNPVSGEETDLGRIQPDDAGNWNVRCGGATWFPYPIYQDWVFALETM
ncbi:MAG: DUF4038 domain-containing protein [Phycisphaeraceae bacterium]|nr:DUF4038 domain-containing protein [Phycisphaeraceae bacterium]